MTKTIYITIRDQEKNVIADFMIEFYKRKQEEFKLDHETFYRAYNEGKLHSQNIEMRLVKSFPFSIDDMVTKNAHVHQGNDQQRYICYVPEVKDMDEAVKISTSWAILTTFHMKYQADIGFFISFSKLMIKKNTADKELNMMDEFPLWIIANQKWTVEFEVSDVLKENTKEILDALKKKYSDLG